MRIFLAGLTWAGRLIVMAVLLVGMTNCTTLGLNYASLDIEGKPAAWPPIAGDPQAFLDQREMWMERLETHVFGSFPQGVYGDLVSHEMVKESYLGGRGKLEEYVIEIRGSGKARRFTLAIAWPARAADEPVPVIISQSFCGNQTAFSYPGLSAPLGEGVEDFCGGGEAGLMAGAAKLIFGRYIMSPPMQQVLDRGYAYASFYTSEVIPDSAKPARALMPDFPHGPRGEVTGTIAGWAAGFTTAIDVLEADPRTDRHCTVLLGHSRSGKSALVAGTYDRRVDAIIAHQAGTGGAALSRDKIGESVEQITGNYPHWFDPAYASFDAEGPKTTPVDMHVLLALNAPTPLLVGNGRRDVWSDPNGTWRATLEAAPIYEAAGTTGLQQDAMREANLTADLVYWLRPGGHSITQQDWDVWLTWLDNVMPREKDVSAGQNEASLPQ